MIEIDLPWPPSVNSYYRHVGHKTLISAPGRQYRAEVVRLLRPLDCCQTGRVMLHVLFFPPDRRRRDIDNHFKGLLDALVHGGLMVDDEQIDDLRGVRGPVTKGGLVRVTIGGIE